MQMISECKIDIFVSGEKLEDIDLPNLKLIRMDAIEITEVFKKEINTIKLTSEVINDAKEKGVDLIITHHPIIFRPMKSFTKGNLAFELAVKGGVQKAYLKLYQSAVELFTGRTVTYPH